MSQSAIGLFSEPKRANARCSRRGGTAMVCIYPFLDGVGLTNGPLGSRNATGDAAVALAHAPELAADLLSSENTAQRQ